MLPDSAGRLVGLITIEDLPLGPDAALATRVDREDATLSQVMARLAGQSGTPRQAFDGRWASDVASSRLTACQLEARATSRLRPPAWLSADLANLAAELDLAAAEARRQIAEARQVSG